jgi:arginine N-succinyltransferase
MLKAQGFRYNDVVDIFDAGPTVEAFIDHIDTVREAVRMSAAEFSSGDLRVPAGLIALASVGRFAVTQFARGEDTAEALKRIGAALSDEVLVYRLQEKRA